MRRKRGRPKKVNNYKKWLKEFLATHREMNWFIPRQKGRGRSGILAVKDAYPCEICLHGVANVSCPATRNCTAFIYWVASTTNRMEFRESKNETEKTVRRKQRTSTVQKVQMENKTQECNGTCSAPCEREKTPSCS